MSVSHAERGDDDFNGVEISRGDRAGLECDGNHWTPAALEALEGSEVKVVRLSQTTQHSVMQRQDSREPWILLAKNMVRMVHL